MAFFFCQFVLSLVCVGEFGFSAFQVYFELEHHAPHLRKIIDDQHSRLQKALGKLSEVEEKQEKIEGQIANAVQFHNVLEERLVKLRNLPGTHKKPLSKAEREFKSEIGIFFIHPYTDILDSFLGLNFSFKNLT